MRRSRRILLALGVGVVSCGLLSLAILTLVLLRSPALSEPERAAQDFLTAMKQRDCERVWQHFTRESQQRIAAESARLIKEGYGQTPDGKRYTDAFLPKQLYCQPTVSNRYIRYVPESVKLLRLEGARAIIHVQEAEGTKFLFPGFFARETIYHDREIVLVQEAAAWRVELDDPNRRSK